MKNVHVELPSPSIFTIGFGYWKFLLASQIGIFYIPPAKLLFSRLAFPLGSGENKFLGFAC